MTAGIANIPFTYYYKNPSSNPAAPFMPSDLLIDSLLCTLQEFPILVSCLVVNGSGHGFVIVDGDNPNMPDIQESQSSVHYRTIETANFSWSAVPDSVVTVFPCPTADISGALQLLNVNIVRLQDNSSLILFANIPHYVMDGRSYGMFMQRWAEVCRCMCGDSTAEPPTRHYEFNHRAVGRALPYEMAEMSPTLKHYFATQNAFGDHMSWLSPEARGKYLIGDAVRIPARTHTFHITHAAIASIRERIAGASHTDNRVSDNDILCALISHAIARGIADYNSLPENKELWGRPTQMSESAQSGAGSEFTSFVAFDMRPRIGLLDANFVGGRVVVVPVPHTMSSLSRTDNAAKMLSTATAGIRAMVDGLTGPFVNLMDYVLSLGAGGNMHFWGQVMSQPQKVLISNQTRFGLYKCDFGNGVPRWVSALLAAMTNLAAILSLNPESDGYDVYLSVESHVMEGILTNELWNGHARLMY
ncbi:hypothetical protein LPJ61_005489 [Coemansia biformis]|uniref:Uncharacterized protein n=1 Tax=Coemansia biformis TaxID=1286918 RepID=A0A9W7Y7J4_9FUNG|nr:hypothetical protein LPJ61_005489 [Coemansia biformis]